MGDFVKRYGVTSSAVMLGLVVFWIAFLIILPNVYMFEQSFRPYLPASEVGGPLDTYTLKNYATVFTGSTTKPLLFWDVPIHFYVLLQTIGHSATVTLAVLLVSYPMGYALAKKVPVSRQPLMLTILIVPLLISDVLRTFAWYLILAFSGPLNAFLGMFGVPKTRWINGFNAIDITLVYGTALFMVIPIYNSIVTLDQNQLEAAEDLGARRWRLHWDLIIPHAKTGIAFGCTMVFMFSVGTVVVPNLMASPNSRWFTQIIEQWVSQSFDWNTAAAYSFLLLGVSLGIVFTVMRLFRVNLGSLAD